MKALTQKAIVIAIIASVLLFLDEILIQLLKIEGRFTWVSFISWTVFYGATVKERLKAIPGFIIGFAASCAIINLGVILSDTLTLKILGVGVAGILAIMIVNFVIMYFEKLEKIYLNSITGIFVGVSLTFSGLGVNMKPSLEMLGLILIYGVLGLLAGFLTIELGTKKEKQLKKQ